FSVTVKDTTPPVLSTPQDLTVEQAAPAGTVVAFVVSATDVCDASPSVTCSPASGSAFPLGETVVRCTARDASGNTAEQTFKVLVRDTTPPLIAVPQDLVVEQTSRAGAAVTFSVTAADLCDANPSLTLDPPSGSTFPLGETRVTVTATDASGNR